MAFKQAGAGFSFTVATAGAGLDQTSEAERVVQRKALDDILGVLLSAGYFRARIPQLAPFDKVVGGLCWAISSSGAAVDVDLFYDEELALGQKIQLCEVIVKVLRAMQCPSPLQAHQIQGGDFVACFPVVQWLIKKVLEYRRITGDTVRMASEGAFHRSFGHAQAPRAAAAAAGYGAAMPAGSTVAAAGAGATAAASSSSSSAALSSGGVLASRTPAGDAYAGQVEERYRPTRRYRKLQTLWAVPLPPEARVQSCLLEFGERAAVRAVEAADDGAGAEAGGGVGAKGRGGTDFERRFAALQRAARADEETARKAALARERGLLEHMAEAKAGVSGASLGAFVDLQAEELRAAAEGYRRTEEELRALAEGGGLLANTKAGRAAAHARRVGALAKKVESAEEARRGHEAALAAVTAQIEGLRGQLAKAQRYNARAAGEIAKLDATVAALPPEQRAQLKALFDRYTRAESLKDQEARFKASCAAQLADLQARLARLQAEAASGDAARRLAEMTGVHAEAEARLARARAAVAARTREVDRLRRLIDDIPSRGELLQYERRFGELFDEVAEKLDETRKYFSTYNTLVRKRDFMAKEEALVASMLANFAALKNKAQRQSYLDQCQAFIGTIEESLAKQAAAVDAKRAVRDGKAGELQRLVDAQRAYYKAVKEFQEECDRNEALSAAVARREAETAAAAAAGGEA